MTPETHIHVSKSSKELAIELFLTMCAIGGLYVAANPSVIEEAIQSFKEWRKHVEHQFSIWQTLVSIRTLPEREDSE